MTTVEPRPEFSVKLEEDDFYYFVVNAHDKREAKAWRRNPIDYPFCSFGDLDDAIKCRNRLNDTNLATGVDYVILAQIRGGDWRSYEVEV